MLRRVDGGHRVTKRSRSVGWSIGTESAAAPLQVQIHKLVFQSPAQKISPQLSIHLLLSIGDYLIIINNNNNNKFILVLEFYMSKKCRVEYWGMFSLGSTFLFIQQ